MRLLLVGSVMMVITLAGLAPSPAFAQKPHYSKCLCHYGYGNVCSVADSCRDRGGRCRGPCGAGDK
jgi:hypothetical protein